MAEIGIGLAGKLVEVVGSKAIKEICSIWGYKSELDDLRDTITTIRKVLLDAESKDQLSYEAQDYIQKLHDALYDADDFFDEFRTLAELKQHNKDGKLSEKLNANLDLNWDYGDRDDEVPWRSLGGRLRTLQLSNLDIETLPKGMRHLTSLENLELEMCSDLEALPEWLHCLSSLRSLRINGCKNLQLNMGIVRDLTSLQLLEVRKCPLLAERFQDPDGEDWADLQHIPSVYIRAD